MGKNGQESAYESVAAHLPSASSNSCLPMLKTGIDSTTVRTAHTNCNPQAFVLPRPSKEPVSLVQNCQLGPSRVDNRIPWGPKPVGYIKGFPDCSNC